jgi:BirA family biotin operon repressor/biotin-[acetyl-CoA-carboxylase] ligase
MTAVATETMTGGEAVVRALAGCGVEHVQVKWPNDVVVDDRKLAGVLAEADGTGAVVVGMGLNVRADWFPAELRNIATAFAIDRAELLVTWLRAYDDRLGALDAVVPDATTRSATIGRRVRVQLGSGTIEGVARAMTSEGYLVVDDHVITAGDVMHLRSIGGR